MTRSDEDNNMSTERNHQKGKRAPIKVQVNMAVPQSRKKSREEKKGRFAPLRQVGFGDIIMDNGYQMMSTNMMKSENPSTPNGRNEMTSRLIGKQNTSSSAVPTQMMYPRKRVPIVNIGEPQSPSGGSLPEESPSAITRQLK